MGQPEFVFLETTREWLSQKFRRHHSSVDDSLFRYETLHTRVILDGQEPS